ncbi:MAG: tetratricopeptide repeat protein, partial [Gemmatimonadota bacterium]
MTFTRCSVMRSPDPLAEAVRLSAEGEEAWQLFRRHVEWAQGFALAFLFASDPRLIALFRERLATAQRLRVSGLEVFRPEQTATLVESMMERVRNPSETYESLAAPLWVEVAGRNDDSSWDETRRAMLARLNEHRELLRRNLRRPLILVFPLDVAQTVRETAPDLWSIRDLGLFLPGSSIAQVPAGTLPRPGTEASVDGTAVSRANAGGHPLVREWMRLRARATGKSRRRVGDVLLTGYRAFDAAFEAGDLDLAAGIASETLDLARSVGEKGIHSRDVGLALDRVGDVAVARGQWEEADAAYRESLEIAHRLLESLGETPQALRDVSVSLDRVGNVAVERGQLEEADAAYRESLEIARRLLESVGETPQAVRDVSLSLDRVGDVAVEWGQLEEADAAYWESLEMRRRLLESEGETPQSLRDVSVALSKVGDVARWQGQLEEADAAYRESLEIARRLLASGGETPQSLRDVSVSLERVGDVARERGQLEEADAAYRESLEMRRRLLESVGETPQSLRDVSVALSKVGDVARERGQLE